MPLSRNVSWQNIRNSGRQQTPADSSSSNTDESPLHSSQEGLRNPELPSTTTGGSGTSLQVPSATASDAPRSSQQASQPLAYLRVQVLRATNLIPKDRNGKADPYVVVSLPALAALSHKSNHNSDRYRKKTHAISKTLNPEWKNEVWDFPITAEWLGPDGFFEEYDSGGVEEVEASPPSQDEFAETDRASEALAALDLQSRASALGKESASPGHVEVPTISVAASEKPQRPTSSRRHISSTAIKVLSTSAKGVKLLPKGAAASARAIARVTPRPTYLRRGTGRNRLQRPALSLGANLEIVLWDQDWGGRREYMGEANWPIWEWIKSPRKIEWSDDVEDAESQGTWLTLVSSRQTKDVSGQVQLRVGLVRAQGSPVKSLDSLYRSLVTAAVGTGHRRRAAADSLSRRPRPHSVSAATEDQIRAGVRAVPAAQSVGTGEDFYEDDGLSSEDEEQELLDSESDSDQTSDDDDDVAGGVASDTDDLMSTEEDFTATEGEDEGPLAKHRAKVGESSGLGLKQHASPASTDASASATAGSSQLGALALEDESRPPRRRLLSALGRRPRRGSTGESSGLATPAADDDVSDPLAAQGSAQINSKRGHKAKKRGESGSGDLTASGESKGGRKPRKGSTQKARQEAKRQRKAEKQGYSFKGGSDIVGIVMMEISGAKDLPRWRNSLRTGFDMDPFTIVAFGQKVFRTRVLRHTLNPVWDEKLLYHVRRGEDNFDIKMSIYDWDKISANDHVGSCVLPLSTLLQAAPKPDAKTGLFDQDASALAELKTFQLPLTRQGRDEEVKFGHSSPILTIKAKYMPYAALRQRFWRQLLNQFDTNDSQSLSALELTAMLDSLGSTLTTETIQSFFTSRDKSYENDELSIEEAIGALEAEINKSAAEKRLRERGVSNSQGPPGSPALLSTGADRGEGGTPAEQALDVSGPSAPIPGASDVGQPSSAPMPIPASSRVPTTKDGLLVSNAAADDDRQGFFVGSPDDDRNLKRPMHLSPLNVPRPAFLSKRSSSSTSPSRSPSRQSSYDALRSSPSPLRSGSTPEPQQTLDAKEGDDDRPVERVVLLKTCPLCHMPRLSRKGDGDVITHLAVCASQDWRRVDSLVVRNFVTSNQAHRKFFNKILINATQGAYRLGANSANLIVQDRQTGELIEEKMQVYVRLGIRLLYQGARSRMEGARVKRMLKNMSVKQGKKYDSPASAKEIPGFIAFHNLNVDEIRDPLDSFKTFNQFFYRKLRPDARPVDEPQNPKRLVSSADCRMMAFDSIDAATRLWIKGREFSVERLLGDEFKGKVEDFKNGSLCIFRLAPQDYHRFHCPADAVVGEPVWIEGQYYTVNCMAIRSAIDVYGENVRVVVPFHSEAFGTFYAINIGAMMVGSIVLTVKAGQTVKKGDEMGYYAFGGSTTVCIFEEGRLEFDEDILTNSKASIETLVKQGTGIGRAVGEREGTEEERASS